MTDDVLPVSAILVSRNEAHHLRECLPLLRRRCDELHVVDLRSSDGSGEVAAACGATVTTHDLVAIADEVYPGAAAAAGNDWILTTDPDERLPEPLLDELAELVRTGPSEVGIVYAPLQYRFAGRPLRGTVWGGTNRRRLLVHRRRADFVPNVHAGVRIRPGYRELTLASTGGNVVEHYWVAGWRDLFEKHVRYLRVEGASRHRHGQRTRWRDVALAPLAGFRDSFFRRRGYRDGLLGFALSLFWAWYSTSALLALRLHQRRAGNG